MAEAAADHSDELVVVTGAAGYVGSNTVKLLLERGYRVRGTVRDPSSPKYAFVRELPGAEERLELVAADLLSADCWGAVFEGGVTKLLHIASPFQLSVKSPEELTEPAQAGTENVLRAAAAAGVRKVVLTSSVVAITQGGKYDHGETLTEDNWNEDATPEDSPYPLSKVLAERKAWELAEELDLQLAVINPSFVMGPPLGPRLDGTSVGLIQRIMSGKMPWSPRMGFGIVDVRDVALAHVLAMEKEDASGRHICSAESRFMLELCDAMRPEYAHYPLPKSDMSKGFTRFLSWVTSDVSTAMVEGYGLKPSFDNSRIREQLGIEFRPLKETMVDMAAAMIEHGLVKDRKKK
eukprot:PLAT15842.1.p1 GENE.PLAT15842.1~~PLAT15842.1.p1  ORF type:complete len:350 (+),score=165.18 PLAT15842.1:32-1081(+)